MKLKDKQALIADDVLLCLAAVNIIVMIVMMITDNDYVLVPVSLVLLCEAGSSAIRAKRAPEPSSTNFFILKWGCGLGGIMCLCAELYLGFFGPVD